MFKQVKDWVTGSYHFGKSLSNRIFGTPYSGGAKALSTMFDMGAGIGLGYLTIGNAVFLVAGAIGLAAPVMAAASAGVAGGIAAAVGVAAVKLCVGVVFTVFTASMAGITAGFFGAALEKTGLSGIGFSSKKYSQKRAKVKQASARPSALKNAPGVSKDFGNSGTKSSAANSNAPAPKAGKFKF